MKEESEKGDLKPSTKITKIMASSPITSWQIEGRKVEAVTDFILWAPKSLQMVTTAMKLKMLAPWKESYDRSRQHIKSREIPLPTKVHIVKAVVFLVAMYVCKSWTIRKAEHGRIDAFKLWCWRGLLRVPWTARRSNQSNPKGNQV